MLHTNDPGSLIIVSRFASVFRKIMMPGSGSSVNRKKKFEIAYMY